MEAETDLSLTFYHRQQLIVSPRGVRLSKNCNLHHSGIKFDRSNKFYLCYYGQVNSLPASKHLLGVTFILPPMVARLMSSKVNNVLILFVINYIFISNTDRIEQMIPILIFFSTGSLWTSYGLLPMIPDEFL